MRTGGVFVLLSGGWDWRGVRHTQPDQRKHQKSGSDLFLPSWETERKGGELVVASRGEGPDRDCPVFKVDL